MRSLRRLAFAIVLFASVPSAAAQQTIDRASIGGRVTDPSGAVVPGASIVVTHTETGVASAATTEQDGRFRFPQLQVGTYEVVARLSGFRDARRVLTVQAGAALDLPIVLQVDSLDAQVTVFADTAVLETARSQLAATVAEAEVRALPMNGRNFLDIALLAPGVSPTNIPSTQLFPETSAVPGMGLSIASQRNLSNSFVVDGLSANDDAAGLSGITYSVDAVEQFQVVTSGGQAELGRALGGYLNVVTRSGTNTLRGSAYGYLRDDRLNAANALSGTRLPMRQWQFGASAGGPIVRNRTFYFGNVEHKALDQSGLTTIAPEHVAAINARLDAAGYGGPRVSTGVYASPVDASNSVAKVDHQASGRTQLGLRHGYYGLSARNSRGAGALNAPTASSHLDNVDHTAAARYAVTLTPGTLLETRAQAAWSDLKAPPADAFGPAVSIAGVAAFGTSSGSPTRRVSRMYQVVNNVSHHAGSHALKAGVDVLYNDARITYPRAARGSYVFSSLANFLAGVYNNAGFSQAFGASDVSVTNPNVAVFAQDEWNAAPALTLNLGIRYDLQYLDSITPDRDNISPRAGFAWSPGAAGRTVVRGSAGLFYDRVPLRAVANALLSAGNTTDPAGLRQVIVSLSPTQAGAPVFPAILDAPVAAVTLPNLTTMDRSLQNAHSRQAALEVEQQIGARTTISAGYHYLEGRGLLMSVNQNVPSCAASGGNNGCRPDPAYANNAQYSAAGESNYHGLQLSIAQRPGAWGHFRVSYTLSRSMNNVGEFFFSSPIDPLDLSKDWGRSDDDQRHRLVVHGAVQTPAEGARAMWQRLVYGFQLSGMVQAYSALPFNITSGVTTIQGTPGRPLVNGQFIERNAGVGSDFLNVSARLSRLFRVTDRTRVEAVLEVFNLTNRANVITRNASFGTGAYPDNPSASFGRPTAVGEPRSAQLGIRLRF